MTNVCCRFQHIDVIKLLIKKGINPLIDNNYNQSPLDYAKKKYQNIEVLLKW